MAENTLIEWTHRPGTIGTTHTITMGCRRRSPGCGQPRWDGDLPGGCFAIRDVVRQRHLPGRAGLVARDDSGVLDWTGSVALLPERLRKPYSWLDPHTVFVNDLSELFDDDVPDAYIAAWWCVMFWTSREVRTHPMAGRRRRRPVHTYLVLGKNHARMLAWLHRWGDQDTRMEMITVAHAAGWVDEEDLRAGPWMPRVLDNVWIMVSAETQWWLDIRVSALLRMPAAVRGVSAEPLLGPLDATPYLLPRDQYCQSCGHRFESPRTLSSRS